MTAVNINYLRRLIQPHRSYLSQAFDKLDSTRISIDKRFEYCKKINQGLSDQLHDDIKETLDGHLVISPNQQDDLTDEPTWVIFGIIEAANFIYHNPHFAFALGFYYKQSLEHCCCYDVLRDELFTVSRGKGVQLNQKSYKNTPQPDDIALSNIIIDNQVTLSPDDQASLQQNQHHTTQKQISMLDAAYFAVGRYDIMITQKPTDSLLDQAIQLFYQEAGLQPQPHEHYQWLTRKTTKR